MGKYRKKPIVIEAIHFTRESEDEVYGFITTPHWADEEGIVIKTLEGNHLAKYGDWIIKGVAGEFYPCKPDIFDQTYEAV